MDKKVKMKMKNEMLIAQIVDINSGFGAKRYVKNILPCEKRTALARRRLVYSAFQASRETPTNVRNG